MLYLRSAFFTLLLPGTVVGWVPMLLLRDGDRFDIGAGRWVGPVILAFGGCGLLWCIWDFARVGRGTLAPVDPPRFLVRGGLYRYVRNPMYVSNVVILVGEVVLFESWEILWWLAAVALAFHLFAVLYEEPALRRQFGDDYDAYRRSVPRWLPRLRTG